MPFVVKPIDPKTKYGLYVVIKPGEPYVDCKGRRNSTSICECLGCNELFRVLNRHLRTGHATICKDCSLCQTSHGFYGTTEYRAWANMIQRCCNEDHPQYDDYGGRGIKVCTMWQLSFEIFLRDVGKKPRPELSLDRINNNGNYEPGNVKWSTQSEQNFNRRAKIEMVS